MAKMGSFSLSEMKKLQKQLNKIQQEQAAAFAEACAKELAARLLAKVIKRTPTGDYAQEIEVVAKRDSKYHKKGDVYKKRVNPSGKMGGTLRRGWTAQTHEAAAKGKGKGVPSAETVQAFVNSLEIKHEGNMLSIEIVNPVEYASYVEFGHRTRGGGGWVAGQYFLTLSEKDLERVAPVVIEKKLEALLREAFNV